MTSLSSLGIGSGMDTATMLEQLKASEQTRLTPYNNLKYSYQSKISTWGQISSSLSSLQDSVEKLSGAAFNTLSIGTNKAFTATVTGKDTAMADSHAVTVTQLAVAHKLKTGTYDSADMMLGEERGSSRVVTISQTDEQGKATTLRVELKDDETSLNQIAKAINKQPGNVNATVQRTDSGYQLELSSKTTGSAGQMSINVEGDEKLSAILTTNNGGRLANEEGDNGDAMFAVTAAKDAKLIVDGDTYTRSSNNISDIISGVSLDLKTVSEDAKPEQLVLSIDTSAIKSSVQDFVKKYNALLTQTSGASKYVPNDTSGLSDEALATLSTENGALMGDGTLRDMVGNIRSTVNGVYGNVSGKYSSLANLGIKIDAASGQMTLDDSALDAAIADNSDDIANIFMGYEDGKGLATALGTIIKNYVGDSENKTDGIIKSSVSGLNEQVNMMQTQIDKTQKIVNAQIERYRVQFQNLDSIMSKLNNMSTQITSVLASLVNNN